MGREVETWEQLGHRVAAARVAAGLTQAEAAEQAQLDRTALAKIERGQRHLSALELSRLSTALRRPLEWFLRESAPAVVSRRSTVPDETEPAHVDELIERLARDVELLLELELIRPPVDPPMHPMPRSIPDAAAAARSVRERFNGGDGPLNQLSQDAERVGLLAFVLNVEAPQFDGAYVSLEEFGVALVNGWHPSGRRRFTLVHELGHHVFQDAYATDWGSIDDAGQSERMINVFAIHLLLPRSAATRRWRELEGHRDARSAALRLAVQYRISWSALCAHLRNIELISAEEHARLAIEAPRKAEFLELGMLPVEDLHPPALPPEYIRAVLRGYRSYRLGVHRTLELLWGTAEEEDLPTQQRLPIDALRGELGPPL